jgi:uncharacterized transporter YbjL
MLLLIFLAMFFVIEAYMEKMKFRVGHTTGIVVILGILVSYALHTIQQESDSDVLMEDLRFE